jgi:hypothetical protein
MAGDIRKFATASPHLKSGTISLFSTILLRVCAGFPWHNALNFQIGYLFLFCLAE